MMKLIWIDQSRWSVSIGYISNEENLAEERIIYGEVSGGDGINWHSLKKGGEIETVGGWTLTFDELANNRFK